LQEAKNTARALVRIGYDGTVHKSFRAKDAEQRFENELRVLQHLERRGCDFVPRVLDYDREKLELVTTNCGARVQQITDEKLRELFTELESYGVRHDDPYLRNVTYRATDGRFCIIDFEFATILDEAEADAHATPLREPVAATFELSWSGMSDIGKYRPNNEDRFLAVAFNTEEFAYLAKEGRAHVGDFDFVFAVSDGMGGENSGEFASKFALDNITRLLPRRYHLASAHSRSGVEDCLNDLFAGIHRQLTMLGESYPEGRDMGATLSMLWYVQGWFYFGHVGDSRVYHLPRSGGIHQLTDDHTHVGWLRRAGKINEREARHHPRKNVLAQALGAGNRYVNPHIGEVPCDRGDRFLLCTDGVNEGLWDRRIEELIREPPPDLRDIPPGTRLVQAAIEECGRDNATALVVEVM
jgi:serine/threonine protein phosphatase PrpC